VAVQYTRVPTVAVGDPITSRQAAAMAAAGNDRILSGIGDGAWRIAMGIFNGWRQPRNPADFQGLIFPSQAEAFEVFHHVEPEDGFQQPQAGPGEPEGSNLGNPLNQFVFGNPQLDSEENRLNEGIDKNGNPTGVPIWLGDKSPETAEEIWELGKAQRGVIDPETFLQSVPAMEAAQSFFQITTPLYSPMGKSYGGFFPTPVELLSDCGTADNSGLGIASFQIFFTAKRTDVATGGFHGSVGTNSEGLPTVTYAGTCPLWTDFVAAGHVIAMARLPFTTYLAVADGAGGWNVDAFPTADWIEGPYEGEGMLDHDDGEQVARAVWRFCLDFRGTPAQRTPDDFKIQDIAFDFQEFGTRQYYLAPALGKFEGGQLISQYPLASLSSSGRAGDLFTFNGGSTVHETREGFVCAGFFLKADSLASDFLIVEVLDGDTVIDTAMMTRDAQGTAQGVFFLDAPYRVTDLKVRMKSDLGFTSPGGMIRFEAAELLDYKGNWWDFYLLLRMSATRGGDIDANGVDGRGLDYDDALGIWESYSEFGCILNSTSPGVRQTPDWVNDNPVYDAERRFARDHVKIMGRRQFVSYEVAGGKSILRFLRYVTYPGVDAETFDCFKGIAPPKDALETLIAGETYTVRATTGAITHGGSSYGHGQQFTAFNETFQATGDAKVFVYDGIRTTALPKGWTNRHVMFLQTKCYHPSESSIWKPEAYSDYFAWNQRCHFYSGSAANARFRRHVTYNYGIDVEARADGTGFDTLQLAESIQPSYIAPEAPSGYNYAYNANNTLSSDNFRNSCQIYQAPYEIESATVEFDGLGREIVKLVFKGRFDAHPSAPATVNKDPSTWSGTEVSNLHAEAYRTDDNALREFILHGLTGEQCTFKTGDTGTNSSLPFLPDNPFGSCYPHFFFVHLLPEPYDDGNDTQEETDTRATIDMMCQAETYLRYMCEGFIDGQTSLAITCKTGTGNLYDYRFRNLCFDAFNGSAIGAFSLEDRDDDPAGFGALPNTLMYADIYNRLGSCFNLLTRARVMLPFGVECRSQSFTGVQAVTPDWPPTPSCHTDAGQYGVVWTGAPAPAGTAGGAFTAWSDCGLGAGADSFASISTNSCPVENGTQFNLVTTKTVTEYRVALLTGWENAVPIAWRDEIASIGGFIGTWTHERSKAKCDAVSGNINDSQGCCPSGQLPCVGALWDTGGSFGWGNCGSEVIESVTECRLLDAGTLNPGTPPAGLFFGAHNVQDPPARCANGSTDSLAVTIYTDPGFYVAVPLVDLL
jgi:hypothetical protein